MAQGLKLKAVGTNFSLKDHIYDVLKDGITNMNIYAADANLKLEERKWPINWGSLAPQFVKL